MMCSYVELNDDLKVTAEENVGERVAYCFVDLCAGESEKIIVNFSCNVSQCCESRVGDMMKFYRVVGKIF